MFDLNLPEYDIKLKKSDNTILVWDELRRKYVVLTPEEWVRQHFVNFLITERKYPKSLITNEKQVILNGQKKRCDTIVYNNLLMPLVIIEYKSPTIPITQMVFDQIARYNIVLKVDYLIVSNGLSHYCCKMDYSLQTYTYLSDIPFYTEL
ncbi:MAG: type I restriction enzyme HsdR N-terminal domain-containing protein [Dysgonomonas sp.]